MTAAAPYATLRCANCGADVSIMTPATVTATCGHCSALLLRGDVDLELLGEVALPTSLRSRFQIGTEGRFGARAFVVRGQIQLDHGAGLWNEWAAETDDGWLWIAEAQGEIQVYEEVEGADVPTRERLPDVDPDTGAFLPPGAGRRKVWRAGDWISIDGDRWRVRELGRGTVVTFKGEFPIRMEPGTRTTYIDLVRGASEVATLDFTRPAAPEFLKGRVVTPSELTLDPSTQPDDTQRAVKAASVGCTNCGGTIEVQDEERALTLGCIHCGTVLQRANQMDAYRAVEEATKIRTQPDLPIGAVGTLRGETMTILGMLQRGVSEDGEYWKWREYLARTDDGAYRWLVESDGHWTFVRPIALTQAVEASGRMKLGDVTARIFSTGDAVVDTVLGEFYWQVRVGDRAATADYVHPKSGRMLSTEASPLEASMSLAHYVEPRDVEDAFPGANVPRRSGVGAVQPNPHSAGAVWKAFILFAILLVGSCVGTRVTKANAVVHQATYGPTAMVAGQETVNFSEAPIEVTRDGKNLRLRFSSKSLSNGYIGINGALVHQESGEVTLFRTAVQYYSGVSGGESWSEGKRRSSVLLGKIAKGTYTLRVASAGFDAGVNSPIDIVITSDVPRKLWFFLALFGLLAFPIIASVRAGAFEARRWQNSDFAG